MTTDADLFKQVFERTRARIRLMVQNNDLNPATYAIIARHLMRDRLPEWGDNKFDRHFSMLVF